MKYGSLFAPFVIVLTIILMAIRLTGADLSFSIVFAPLWVPVLFVIAGGVFCFLVGLIQGVLER